MFIRHRFVRVALASFVPVLAIFSGCSSDPAPAAPGTNDGGGDANAEAVVTGDNVSKQTGKIIAIQTDEGIPGATVTIAGKSVVTNETGDYEILVPRNEPYRMTVVANGFYKLIEQEWMVRQATHDRGTTDLVKVETAEVLDALVGDRKPEKGVVLVKVYPRPPCDSEGGSTLTIDPPGEAKVLYFNGSLPDFSQHSVQAGTYISAAFYNVEVGVPVKVIVHSPKCLQAPFPIDVGDVTYTGNLTAEAGAAFAYMRVYIQEPSVNDAGSE
ncbi:MAG TPA: hypothetical protein VM925_32000 [Labilithrix sp.]|nr:hypothetical protein [Labilithrix sp.]